MNTSSKTIAHLHAENQRLRARIAALESDTTHRAIEHAARLDSLLAHAPIGIALLDTELRYQHINASLATMNGMVPDAHLGRTIREVLPILASKLETPFLVQTQAEALSHTNAELTRALRVKDEFLAMMSHELRTSLNGILGISESLDEGVYGPVSAPQRQAITMVRESGLHLLAILSDILDLAHIEADHAY